MNAGPRPGAAGERADGGCRGVVSHLWRGRGARPIHWDALPTRVVQTTRMVLDELDRAQVHATFFVLGWVAERHPELVAEIVAGGHEVGSHGYAHARAYDLGPAAFAEDLSEQRAGARGRRSRAGHGVPRAGVVDQRALALGARGACARGFYV